MATPVGSIYANLVLDASNYLGGLQKAERATTTAMSGIQRSTGLTTRSVSQFQRSMGQQIRPYSLIAVSRAFDNTADRANLLRGALIATTGVFGGFAAALTSNVVLRYADTFTQLTNQLRSVSGSTEEASAKFKALDDVATRSRSGIKETVILFSRLSKAAPSFDQNKILQYVETIQKALQLGGATAQEAASAAVQFSQAIASNRLGGDELRAVLETPLGLALAKGLGVTIGKLRELGTAGKLTREQLFNALGKIGPDINAQFGNSIQTLDQAITLADNKFVAYLGSVNQSYGITKTLGNAVVGVANNLDVLGSGLSYIVPLIGGLFAGKVITGGLRGISNAVGSAVRDIHNVEAAAAKASSGITGAWTHLREKTESELAATRDAIKKYEADLAAASARKAELSSPTAKPADFAPQALNKQLQRDAAALRTIEEERLTIQNKLRDAIQKVGSANGAVSPKVLAATKAVVEAEEKVNTLLIQQENIRKAAKGNQTRQLGAAALQSQIPTKNDLSQVRAAEAQQIKIAKDLEVANRNLANARQQLSAKFVGLSEAEAAAAEAAAQRQIAAQRAVQAATVESIAIEEKWIAAQGRVISGKNNVNVSGIANQAGEIQKVETAIAGYGTAIAAARAAEGGLIKSTGLVSRSITFAGAGFRSLGAFLGGPWGIALIGATVAFSLFAERSARSAEDAARTQQELADVLGKVADKSNEAAASLETLTRRAKIEKLKQQMEDFKNEVVGVKNEAINVGAALTPNQTVGRQLDPSKVKPNQGANQVAAIIDGVLNGTIKVGVAVARVRQLALELGKDRAYADRLAEQVQKAGELAEAIKLTKEEQDKLARATDVTSTFNDMAKAAQDEKDAIKATNNEVYNKLVADARKQTGEFADAIAAALKSAGINVTKPVQDYINATARLISNLQKVSAAANAPAAKRPTSRDPNIRRPGDYDPNIRRAGKDTFDIAAEADKLKAISDLRDKVLELQITYATARKVINSGPPLLDPKAFGDKTIGQDAIALVDRIKAKIAEVGTAFETDKAKAGDVYAAMEDIRTSLISAGADPDIAAAIVKSAEEAITALPKVKAEYASAKAAAQEFNKAATSRIGNGGAKIIDINAAAPVVLPPLNGGVPDNAAIQPASPEAAAKTLQTQLDTLKTQVEQLPTDIPRRFFPDPIGWKAAVDTATTSVGSLVDKMVSGAIPADQVGTAVEKIKDGLVAAGGNANALDPFVQSLTDILGRIDSVIEKINQMNAAIARSATAGGGGSKTSGTAGYQPPSLGRTLLSGGGARGFASGGAFKVGGAGGTDSQLVQFMASPSETVGIFTPSQMRALGAGLGGGTEATQIHAPITIVAADAASFRSSKRQVQMDLADAVQAAVNRTR